MERMDRIFIKDLLVRHRRHQAGRTRQPPGYSGQRDLLGRHAPAALSDQIEDTVNYRSAAKAIAHIESEGPQLVERLAADLVRACFESDQASRPSRCRWRSPARCVSRSVGLTIYRNTR